VRTQRSARAFAFGAWTGARITLMPSVRKASPKAWTDCGYRAPGTTAADFRKLTPLVLMQALEQAGTVVCEPTVRVVWVPEIPVGLD
jgi:hypothetical protein